LLIGHHEPTRDDFSLKELEKRAIAYRDERLQSNPRVNKEFYVMLAQEGLVVELWESGKIRFIFPYGKVKVLPT